LGYLWVKALWRVLIGPCRKLLDTDLFLAFIIDYFFSDFQLASMMFNWLDFGKNTTDLEEYIEVLEYYIFGQRLNDLVANVNKYVDEYEHHAQGFAPGNISAPNELQNRPSYQNHSDGRVEAIEMALAMGSLRSMHMMWPKFAAARHILRLFSTSAEVEIDETGSFRAKYPTGKEPLVGAALEIARPISKERTSGNGSIEAVLLTQRMKVVLCVFLGYELIATIDVETGNVNDPEEAEACDRLSSYLALEAASVEITEELHYREGSRADELASKLRSRARAKTYEYFSNLGIGTDNGMRPAKEVLEPLNAGGIIKLLEQYPGHAEWLTRLSLSAGGRIATLTEAALHWNISEQGISEWITKVNGAATQVLGKEAFAIEGNAFGLSQF
jgi:hypothetical protein